MEDQRLPVHRAGDRPVGLLWSFGAIGRRRTRRTALRAGRLTVVSGPPGVGKTALAVHTATRVADAFPDGQLFAVPRGPAGDPVDSADVLADLLRDLNVDGSALPGGLDAPATLFRSRLAGRRILIVLDDDARPGRPGSGRPAPVPVPRHHPPLRPGVPRVHRGRSTVDGRAGPGGRRMAGPGPPGRCRPALHCEHLPLDEPTGQVAGGPGTPVAGRPLDWFEAEREALAALALACADAGLAGHARRLAGRCADFYELRGHFEDWRRTSEAALAACRATGDGTGVAVMLRSLGAALVELDDLDLAVSTLGQAKRLAVEADDRRETALVGKDLGFAYGLAGRLPDAEAELRAAADGLADAGLPATRAIALSSLGFLRRQRRDAAGAVEILHTASAVARSGCAVPTGSTATCRCPPPKRWRPASRPSNRSVRPHGVVVDHRRPSLRARVRRRRPEVLRARWADDEQVVTAVPVPAEGLTVRGAASGGRERHPGRHRARPSPTQRQQRCLITSRRPTRFDTSVIAACNRCQVGNSRCSRSSRDSSGCSFSCSF